MPEWVINLLIGLASGGTLMGVFNQLFGAPRRRIDNQNLIIKGLREDNDKLREDNDKLSAKYDALEQRLEARITEITQHSGVNEVYIFRAGIWMEKVAAVLTVEQLTQVGNPPVRPVPASGGAS